MSTMINTPTGTEGATVELIVGLVIAAGVIILFVLYGLPALRDQTQSNPDDLTTVEVQQEVPNSEQATSIQP